MLFAASRQTIINQVEELGFAVDKKFEVDDSTEFNKASLETDAVVNTSKLSFAKPKRPGK